MNSSNVKNKSGRVGKIAPLINMNMGKFQVKMQFWRKSRVKTWICECFKSKCNFDKIYGITCRIWENYVPKSKYEKVSWHNANMTSYGLKRKCRKKRLKCKYDKIWIKMWICKNIWIWWLFIKWSEKHKCGPFLVKVGWKLIKTWNGFKLKEDLGLSVYTGIGLA